MQRSGTYAIGEKAQEVSDDVACIVLGSEDERGLPAPQDRQADCIHSGGAGHDATVVAQIALAIDDRDV